MRFWTTWKWILRRIMTFICRPAGVDIWYIHWIFTYKKNQNNNNKKQEKKFDVNTRVPRRARWDFRGVLNDSLFFIYLKFVINKYLKNWGNYKVLRMKLGYLLLLLLLFIYWRFMRSCAMLRWFCMQIWIFTVLTVSYLQ